MLLVVVSLLLFDPALTSGGPALPSPAAAARVPSVGHNVPGPARPACAVRVGLRAYAPERDDGPCRPRAITTAAPAPPDSSPHLSRGPLCDSTRPAEPVIYAFCTLLC
jgi:hypothetical protein